MAPRRSQHAGDWDTYIESFHRSRAGITERVLQRASAAGQDPYEWLISGIDPTSGLVLDVGAGSGPVARLVESWVGVDRSLQELTLARAAGRRVIVCALSDALPVRDASVGTALLAMSLQVLEPVEEVMAELSRVVRWGGQVVVLLPARRPMRLRDVLFYLVLQWRLGRRIAYPNDRVLSRHRLKRLAYTNGFEVTNDRQASFSLQLLARADAEELVQSLYLPGVSDGRASRAVDHVARRVGGSVAVPLRRVVLRRSHEHG